VPSTSEARLSWTSSGLDFLVHLDRNARGFGAALQRVVRDAIRSGRLHAGDPLPSTRALADDLGVARGTVVAAYEQLIAEGWLAARQGAVTRVADLPSAPPAPADPPAVPAPRHDLRPGHVARFGDRFDAQGVLAGSKDAGRCIGYLVKYLTKQVGDCHQAQTPAEQDHAGRLAEALRYQPCSPTCANWLRYGIQPKNARPGLVPGCCKGKAHDPAHLGYAGRRVLVSRKWSGKTLDDYRAERKEWLLRTLGVSATNPARYAWEPVDPGDPDHMDHARRLLHVVADRLRWQMALAEARRRAESCSATSSVGRAALWRTNVTS
jgi:hypothetical protein